MKHLDTPAGPSLLIIDDDVAFRQAVCAFAELKGCKVTSAATLAEGREALSRSTPDLMLVDLALPDGSGLDLLESVDLGSSGQIVIVTGHPSVESAVRALHLPVLDYLVKPVDGEKLQCLLDKAQDAAALKPCAPTGGDACGELLGDSAAMREVCAHIRQVAPLDVTVFIDGESGTGKELCARAVHDLSDRNGEFVAINCGAVAPELLTSQLFGHEKGSFTGAVRTHQGVFEQARKGTLFLDEITEMPVHLQSHLLRVLETREVTRVGASSGQQLDVRVIAATNRDPKQAVADGVLRSDLYFRLMEFPLHMPPLRDHPQDIVPLAQHFLDRLNARYDTRRRFAAQSIDHLLSHAWPGNVRELKQVVQRAYILSRDEVLVERFAASTLHAHDGASGINFRVGMTIEEMEREMLFKTLAFYDNDKPRAARALGVSVKTIYNKLARYEDNA